MSGDEVRDPIAVIQEGGGAGALAKMVSWECKGRKKANQRDAMCSESEMLPGLSRLLRAGGGIRGALRNWGTSVCHEPRAGSCRRQE